VGIDLNQKCSIEFTTSTDGFAELDQTDITMNLYKVATVDTSGRYTETNGFSDLGLASITDQTTANEWAAKAAAAAEQVETMKDSLAPTKSVTIAKGQTSVKADSLEPGMYLVAAQKALSPYYEYTFSPYLVALPNNYYYTSTAKDDTWVYEDVSVISLKAEEAERYGDLTITKTLSSMNQTLGDALFVFQIHAVKADGKTVAYDDVQALTFSSAGTQSLTIEKKIPAGATVTVTEVYSGASYTVSGDASGTVSIVAQYDENGNRISGITAAGVSFTNDYNDNLIPGSGIVNQFEKSENIWNYVNNSTKE
jgi:hypothetical protein